MNQTKYLQVFISYTGPGKDVWDPLVQYLIKRYDCEFNWAVKDAWKYNEKKRMMEELVRKSHIALFLFTHPSEGITFELELWHTTHGNFKNAILFMDPNVNRKEIEDRLQCEMPPSMHLNRKNPWDNIHNIFPAIHGLFTHPSELKPEWRIKFNRIIQENQLKINEQNFPILQIESFLNDLCLSDKYEKWKFRINWPKEATLMDSYSDEIDCLDLLEALLDINISVAGHEVKEIFDALQRLVKGTKGVETPSRKLAGSILFDGVSTQTQRGVKSKIGSHPYEKTQDIEQREELPKIIFDEPSGLLIPHEILCYSDNYKRFVDAQLKILTVAGKVCRFILCSTFQISISYSTFMRRPKGNKGEKFIAMCCSAAGTNKEQLGAISDIPVLLYESKNEIKWFGQRHKKPTSEHISHWKYHECTIPKGINKNLIVHFHPVELLDLYDLARKGVELEEKEFIQGAVGAFKARGLDVEVFEDFRKYSARSEFFGKFMVDVVQSGKRKQIKNIVIWKPNHGVWLLSDNSQSDAEMVEVLLKIEEASNLAAKWLKKEKHV